MSNRGRLPSKSLKDTTVPLHNRQQWQWVWTCSPERGVAQELSLDHANDLVLWENLLRWENVFIAERVHQWPPKNLVSGFSRGNTKVRLVHHFTSKIHTYWSFRHLIVSLLVGSLSRYSSLVKHDRQLRTAEGRIVLLGETSIYMYIHL